jgi:HD-GYP domain-containing protein (c-di-GMP phosphodiesterase class II)
MADIFGYASPQEMIDTITDIGKQSISAEILSKPAKLSTIEFALIKEHSREGYKILRVIDSP